MHGANRLVYTGRVPSAFGMFQTLVRETRNQGGMVLFRLRSELGDTALSLAPIGSSDEDHGMTLPSLPRPWFQVSIDSLVRLRINTENWRKLNRFQH